MSEPFVGEIRMFTYNFAPRNWVYCDGQLLEISQNTMLFSIVGDRYGGDGRVTMGIPNLNGRVPLHKGTGPGLSPYILGQWHGFSAIKLSNNNIPSHTHEVYAMKTSATESIPSTTLMPAKGIVTIYKQNPSDLVQMSSKSLAFAGGQTNGDTDAHINMQPYTTVAFCIATEGDYPPRN